jgi:hypothetical protein
MSLSSLGSFVETLRTSQEALTKYTEAYSVFYHSDFDPEFYFCDMRYLNQEENKKCREHGFSHLHDFDANDEL